MAQYEFCLLSQDGVLQLQYAKACLNDGEAFAVGRGMVRAAKDRDRLEIWRGTECVYAGMPGEWPVKTRALV